MIFDEFTLKSQIRAVPDFPKPGVVFRDITPLFQSPRALRMTVDSFVQRYIEADFSHIGAMDARGFLIGSAVAYALNKPLVLFRKQGKLPADVLAEGYQTEYGEAFLEVHADSLCEGDSVLIFDDLIATGGTLLAAASLVRRLGARVFEAAAIIDLPELGGSTRLQDAGISTFSLTAFALDERGYAGGRPGAPRSLLAPHLPSGRADLAINDFEMARNDLPLLDNPAIITSANDTFRGVIANSP